MEVDVILGALECQGKPLIRHRKTGAAYYLKDILRVKIAGEWLLGATYYNDEDLFCRGLADFEGFDYEYNELP